MCNKVQNEMEVQVQFLIKEGLAKWQAYMSLQMNCICSLVTILQIFE